ncbi:MAG: transglycosylase SLT domain-containing protein [Burkholderiales bacterium]
MNTAELKQWLQGRLGRLGRLAATLHHGLALIGFAAVLFVVVRGGQAMLDESTIRSAAFGPIRYGTESLVERSEDADNPKYRALAGYLSRRYRIASGATEQLVGAAHDAGQEVGLDPLLILAVMAIESRFNPIAESVVGAKGLMQVMPKHHQDKLAEAGGEESMLDPTTNIFLGARILKEYIRRTGSLEAGLQSYNGALSDASSQYAQKVIAEKERLQQAVRRVERQQQLARNSA